MLPHSASPAEKRAALRDGLNRGRPIRFPGAFNPLTAMMIESIGFEGVYVSGGALSASRGFPDIGLTTLSEVAEASGAISSAVSLPTIVDADTGFGDTANVVRTISTLESQGVSGCHIEDQTMPKRCGHLDHKQLVEARQMAQKVRAAVLAKSDPSFLVIARTDARGVEGLNAAIERAKHYVDAGADMVFPEALADESEFEAFRSAIDVPLMANMTEFGKSPLLSIDQLTDLGYNLVIYPVTTLRLAMKAIESGLRTIDEQGSQSAMLSDMQSRKDLYELLRYESYARIDKSLHDFQL